ncbi:MAG: TonB-dependent receptor [Pseudomonadota bacterium]
MRLALFAALAASLSLAPSGIAAETRDVSAASASANAELIDNGAIVRYPPGFFTIFAPVTALDMVSRMPGFSLSDGDTGRRGLGDAFGNLLIDGSRPSDKSVGLRTVLQRIPARDVARIELIREPLPQYDMRGHSQIANVILRQGAGVSTSFDSRVEYFDSSRVGGEIEFSHTRPVGPAEVTVSFESGFSGRRRTRVERDLSPARALIDEARENDQRRYRETEAGLTILTPLAGGRFRLNAASNFNSWRRQQRSEIFAPDVSGALVLDAFETVETENSGRSISATATFDREFGAIASQSVLLVERSEDEDGPETFSVFDPVALAERSIVTFESEDEETALRQTFSWTRGEAHAWEAGAEAAFNARDTDLGVFEVTSGGLVEIELPGGTTRVEERRAEIFANHVWAIADTLSMESGLRYEVSEITQSGDAGQERSFSYLKPAFTFAWRPDAQTRWRVTAERDVDQLNFSKFASTIDLDDDQIDLGNPDYRPQTTWTLEGEWERRFGEAASVSLTVGRDWISDLDDFVPLVTPDGVFDAPGNIGDGERYRATLEWSSPLDAIGIPNAVFDGFVEWYHTRVDDPVTNIARAFSGTREWELRFDYRQTFPEHQIAWGWDYFWLSDGAVYRAREFRDLQFPTGDLDIYVETTRWFGMTTRLGADYVLDPVETSERVFFDGSREDGIVRRIRQTREKQGVTAYLRIRGVF